MAQSEFRDLVLGDSVKVETSVEELVTAFGSGKPLMFQVDIEPKATKFSNAH